VGCARELLEETGYPARAVHPLGAAAACTGRLSNRVHSYFVETGERIADFKPEPGMTVALKTPAELAAMIKADEFVQQLHLGALMLAELRSLAGEAKGFDLRALEPFRAEGLHKALYVVPTLAAFLAVVLAAASRTVKKDVHKLQSWMRGVKV